MYPPSHPFSQPLRQRTLRAPKTPAQGASPLRRDRDRAAVGLAAQDCRGRRQRGGRQDRPRAALCGRARVGRAQGAARRHTKLRACDGAPRGAGRVGGGGARGLRRARGARRDDAHAASRYKGNGAMGMDVSLLENLDYTVYGYCGAWRGPTLWRGR